MTSPEKDLEQQAAEAYDAADFAHRWASESDKHRAAIHACVEVCQKHYDRPLEEATGGKPFGECSRGELLDACRWFWMARDLAREENKRLRESLNDAEIEMAGVAWELRHGALRPDDAADRLAKQCEIARAALKEPSDG